jgi:hypothetical protein
MGLFRKTPPRPSMDDEPAFVAWMIKYDNQFKLFREMTGSNLDGIVSAASQAIVQELTRYASGEALLERLTVVGQHYDTIMPLIEKRGGVLNSPLEMQAAFYDCVTKLALIPYFIKYRYGLSLPFEIEELS